MKKGCPESILKEQGKKACYLLREDGPVIEVGENDTLIINKLVGEAIILWYIWFFLL